jgi:hypothetical protein
MAKKQTLENYCFKISPALYDRISEKTDLKIKIPFYPSKLISTNQLNNTQLQKP